jgi:hypothetical protein
MEHTPRNGFKVRFMISYGGIVVPIPCGYQNHRYIYIGGDNRIVAVDRDIKLSNFFTKLSAMMGSDFCFKYQLPGQDLDTLVPVLNEEDFDDMMFKYDHMSRISPNPAKLRLFLFPVPTPPAEDLPPPPRRLHQKVTFTKDEIKEFQELNVVNDGFEKILKYVMKCF